jgi:L-ascorbate metabolism protein UlaG (beta-lactamase superfamily)
LALGRDTAITWLGHATFLIESPSGRRILVDPWLTGNPAAPDPLPSLDQVDLLLVTHGHGDHIGDALAIAKRSGAKLVAMVELASAFSSAGVEDVVAMNKDGTIDADGIGVTMVHAIHSGGFELDGTSGYCEPCGFVVRFENGFRVYIAGDTAVFSDMRLIGELYEPELAILPIGDHFTMGPRQAALALRLLGARHVLPCHYGTFPLLSGTPQALREASVDIDGLVVHELAPGETLR